MVPFSLPLLAIKVGDHAGDNDQSAGGRGEANGPVGKRHCLGERGWRLCVHRRDKTGGKAHDGESAAGAIKHRRHMEEGGGEGLMITAPIDINKS